MSSSSSWRQELQGVRKHLAQAEHPFECLRDFYNGYETGYSAARRGFMTPQEFVPPGFNQFVSEHFGRRWPNAKGWRILIREHSPSEQEAFELFFTLREEYERRHAKVG
jgi:hypothetical protein